MKKHPSEKRIQKWIELLARKGKLHQAIAETHEMKSLFSADYEKKHAPEFSVDYLIRKKTVKAAQCVLAALENVIVVSATKNISKTPGERLLPDLVLLNKAENAIVLVEIKRSEKTERETVTELLGYEQEIRNQLPFIADASLYLLVVSVDFSGLLDHALSNLIVWGKREILALRVNYSGSKWKLVVHFPSAWEDLRYDGLPSDVITTADIHIDHKRGTDKISSPEQLVQLLKKEKKHILDAVQALVRDLESARSSGFVIAWQDMVDKKSDWGLTIGIVDPFRLLGQANQSRTGKSQTPINKTIDLLPEGSRTSLDAIRALTKRALTALQSHGDIRFSKVLSWDDRRKRLMGRALPIEVDFWGTLAEHVREYTTNPMIRERVIPEMDAYGLSWRSPTIGISLLHQITRNSVFVRGNIGASGLFQLGELLGYSLLICRNFGILSPKEKLIATASLRWLGFECVAAFREIIFRYTTASDIEQEPPRLQIPMDVDPVSSEKSLNDFVRWILEHFIGEKQPVHGR
ncbi:MAG TPA: hypothetical protein VF815_26455, partial [Myxococcaceae bacterium]